MALRRRQQQSPSPPAAAPAKRPARARRKGKPKVAAPPAPPTRSETQEKAAAEAELFRAIRARIFSVPEEALADELVASFRLEPRAAVDRIRKVRKQLSQHAAESLRNPHEGLYIRMLTDADRARAEHRWEDARAAERMVAELLGVVPKRGAVVGVVGVGLPGPAGQLPPAIAGVLGVLGVDEVEEILAEGEAVDG